MGKRCDRDGREIGERWEREEISERHAIGDRGEKEER